VQIPLATVPGITLSMDGTVAYARAGAQLSHVITASVRSAYRDTVTATITLAGDKGLAIDSAERSVVLAPGVVRSVRFVVTAHALGPGSHTARLSATLDGTTFRQGYQPIEYDHITPQRRYYDADLQVNVIEVALPPKLKVGYVQGVGDNVMDVLRQLGIDVTAIAPSAVATENLSQYNTIVIGPRAYQAQPELIAYNTRLLDYAQKGGRLVVQYGQYEMTRPGMMPHPIGITRPHTRVTDEQAEVTITNPSSPLLTTPNRIEPGDFEGWVQERALYMPNPFDPKYKPVMSMHDPNEPPNEGALLITPFGKGTYVYTTLAFFRQLPAAVPGATRLFVNLLDPRNR
jgi:hypothetical protein